MCFCSVNEIEETRHIKLCSSFRKTSATCLYFQSFIDMASLIVLLFVEIVNLYQW